MPFRLESSAFCTPSEEALNSTQFQVAEDRAFTRLKVDVIRDVENLYGDTGAPDYEPIDLQADVNILHYTVDGLEEQTYYARVRHRDSNAQWSDWSNCCEFKVISHHG
jgi:hypothetical protein